MTINKKIDGDCITLAIDGWLDVETTPILEEYIKNLEESKKLIFDFKNLEYISSSGIRQIVVAYKRQKDSGSSFEIINTKNEVMDIFKMTGIYKKISIS